MIGYITKHISKLVMRLIFVVLVLTFGFQSWTNADEISDFQIEGMSIGDSALEYFR